MEDREIKTPETSKAVSRRDFLKMAGVAGATIGAAGGLGGLLAACGSSDETTTTAAATGSTAAAETTTTAAGETTTSAAGVEEGGEIKCGYVIPVTGAMAAVRRGWPSGSSTG